jgi:hypothetical protein
LYAEINQLDRSLQRVNPRRNCQIKHPPRSVADQYRKRWK